MGFQCPMTVKSHPARRPARGLWSTAALCICFALTAQAAEPAPSLFTNDQAERGAQAYMEHCSACHGTHLDDGDFGGAPLRGKYFADHWRDANLSSLFAYAKNLMPPDRPGSLTDATYAAILAFVLQANGYGPGSEELPTDASSQEKMSLAAP